MELKPGTVYHLLVTHDADCAGPDGGLCVCLPEQETVEHIEPVCCGCQQILKSMA